MKTTNAHWQPVACRLSPLASVYGEYVVSPLGLVSYFVFVRRIIVLKYPVVEMSVPGRPFVWSLSIFNRKSCGELRSVDDDAAPSFLDSLPEKWTRWRCSFVPVSGRTGQCDCALGAKPSS